VEQPREEAGGRFGFAVSAEQACGADTDNGRTHVSFAYDLYPPIDAVRPSSVADRAGLRVGDRIVKIDGKSIRDDASLLARVETRDRIRLTVRRDGRDLEILLIAPP